MNNILATIRKYSILLLIFVVLAITNPSRTSFVSYLHYSTDEGSGRDFNGLVFSIYSTERRLTYLESLMRRQGRPVVVDKIYYLGILGNFIKLSK